MKNNDKLINLYYYKNNNLIKLCFLTNISIFLYFLIRISRLEKIFYELKSSSSSSKENISNNKFSPLDKDLVGMTYPDIFFDNLKSNLTNGYLVTTLIDFLNQLETKLIYLEKEINVTKIFSFYHIRANYLNKIRVEYNDEYINELHNIINWVIIHKSNQLMGIVSDKYLVCKYAQNKLGENLCSQRIKVYDNVEEINFEELVNKGNIILKITNGCHDSVFINNNQFLNKSKYIEKIKSKVKYNFQRDYGFTIPEFYHFYSKKRIIEEKQFIPFEDLYEFKFFIINQDIKFSILYFQHNKKLHKNFYNSNYELLNCSEVMKFDIFSIFDKNILDKLKYYAYKLSEDFKNFIRVDLYVFHKKIYLSELTFDSASGNPFYSKEKFIINAGKNFTKYK